MSKYHNRWSDEETATARKLLARDASEVEFMDALGRSRKAALARIRSVDFPRDRSLNNSRIERKGIHVNAKGRSVPDCVIADRDRRQFAARTITALICGDPGPGQSALDKRGTRV